ncbi:MAG: hypothetical protein ACN6OP_05230 [Pseudomonadales bacterium]
MTYSKLKLVHSGNARPDQRARNDRCYRHTSVAHGDQKDIAAHAHVDITQGGEFRCTIKAPEDELLPLITASYIMLGELIEQLGKHK